VAQLYKRGEIDRAIQQARSDGADRRANILERFKSIHERGARFSREAGLAPNAVRPLEQALEIDREISGGEGVFHDDIAAKLSKVYFLLGVEAHNNRKYSQAYRYLCGARKYRPESDAIKKRLHDLGKTAKRLYEEAYIIRSSYPDQASGNLRTVLSIVPPNHVYYYKAKKLLDRIRGVKEPDSSTGDGF
jgi:hypothetical protein